MQPWNFNGVLILFTILPPENSSRAALLFVGEQHKANKVHKSY